MNIVKKIIILFVQCMSFGLCASAFSKVKPHKRSIHEMTQGNVKHARTNGDQQSMITPCQNPLPVGEFNKELVLIISESTKDKYSTRPVFPNLPDTQTPLQYPKDKNHCLSLN